MTKSILMCDTEIIRDVVLYNNVFRTCHLFYRILFFSTILFFFFFFFSVVFYLFCTRSLITICSVAISKACYFFYVCVFCVLHSFPFFFTPSLNHNHTIYFITLLLVSARLKPLRVYWLRKHIDFSGTVTTLRLSKSYCIRIQVNWVVDSPMCKWFSFRFFSERIAVLSMKSQGIYWLWAEIANFLI